MDQHGARTFRLGAVEAALPLLVAVVAVTEASLVDVPGRGTAAVLEVAACLMLVARRRWPLVVCPPASLLVMAVPGEAFEHLAAGVLVHAVAVYALARWAGERSSLAVFTATSGVVLLVLGDWRLTDLLWAATILLPPYLLGRLVRGLVDHADLLVRERELAAQEAVREERDRLARELHDVVAHSLSAMVVQVAAGRDLVRRDPAEASRLLRVVGETGRRALAETDRLVQVMGDAPSTAALSPMPGVRELPALAAEFRTHGLRLELVADDPGLSGLPAAVDVSVHRIVTEALTNALRYSADRTVRLELRRTPAGVLVRATNPSSGRTGDGSGLGLVGLRERVELLGGELRHGTTPGGDFEVVAELPLPEREPA